LEREFYDPLARRAPGGQQDCHGEGRERELGDEAQKLIDGERDDAEHEMAHDFGVAAHAHRSAAELVFDPRVDALDGSALIVADRLGWSVAKPLAPPFLRFELRL
jgi:hypothetical protein